LPLYLGIKAGRRKSRSRTSCRPPATQARGTSGTSGGIAPIAELINPVSGIAATGGPPLTQEGKKRPSNIVVGLSKSRPWWRETSVIMTVAMQAITPTQVTGTALPCSPPMGGITAGTTPTGTRMVTQTSPTEGAMAGTGMEIKAQVIGTVDGMGAGEVQGGPVRQEEDQRINEVPKLRTC